MKWLLKQCIRPVILRACVCLTFLAVPVAAQGTFEKLLMPGPLSSAHAKFEENCQNCHKPFSKGAQDVLCLACHKEIAADRAASSGFHGKSKLLTDVTCSHCHGEHEGRQADIVQIDNEIFDHNTTDYPLLGAHKQVECNGCHLEGKKWSEAAGTCFGCHEEGQPHKGNLGKNCENCHEVSKWSRVAAFNHSKTKFALLGRHANVVCMGCHIGEIYKNLPSACNECHAIQDVHERRFGEKCESCHTVDGWKTAKFDHAKNTRFPLLGAHAKSTCQDCHHDSFTAKLSMACVDCHEKQDVHKASLGKNCADCHAEVAWRNNVRFDHGLSKFPLIGLHVVTACEDCHKSAVFGEASIECVDCHKADDAHDGRLTSSCERCHTANGWQKVPFDHDRQTRFALTGAHAKAGCHDCHRQKNVADASLPISCYACHRAQDVHRGTFGTDCAKCHTTSTFSTAFIRKQ